MLPKKEEYEIMHEVEEKLWWYKMLHKKVLLALKSNFKDNRNIKILDACCGTGGLLKYLKKNDFHNQKGFDLSPDAVAFCEKFELNVSQSDLKNINVFGQNETFDAIICNDAFYFLSDNEIKIVIGQMLEKLNKGGLIISNNHSFNIFKGIHDIAVGSNRRFLLSDFENIFAKIDQKNRPKFLQASYWSLFLSPLILAIRLFQQLKIGLGLVDFENVKSDLSIPNKYLNHLLYSIVSFETEIISKSPFGSSCFWVIQKQ